MLDISRSERYLILTFIIIGLFFTSSSYHQKRTSNLEIKRIDFREAAVIININTATLDELERLPGIGPVLARDITDYRKGIGGFKNKQELMDVKGIGEKKFDRIKDLISISE